MTDIVERLRTQHPDSLSILFSAQEAAGEIERLRAALAGIVEATDLDEVSVIARRALALRADLQDKAMTDNVVIRLRSRSPYLSGSSAERTMLEAAAEIERLAAEIARLTAEIERLYR